ncbi:MAG TPA: hypothetical protein VMV62_02210 [Candidatus Paceibacterota bacterium]|nr:hypothetical protein [Candidatus Paceibacterota bacterium]
MVPKYVFDEAWLEGNFLIPTNKVLRGELRKQLQRFVRHKVMLLPENKVVEAELSARIAAIKAYNALVSKTKK